MDEVDRVTVSLPMTDELQDAIREGEFASADAAVEAAVEAWSADRMVERIGVEQLRRHWDQGLASGDPRRLDVDDVLKRAFARAQAIRDARHVEG